jgi:hypothetical protein
VLYLLAVFFPWLSLFLIGRPWWATFNLLFWICLLPLTLLGIGIWGMMGLTVHAWVLIHAAATAPNNDASNKSSRR